MELQDKGFDSLGSIHIKWPKYLSQHAIYSDLLRWENLYSWYLKPQNAEIKNCRDGDHLTLDSPTVRALSPSNITIQVETCLLSGNEREQWVLQYHARILSGEFDKESGELSHARDVIGNSWIKFRRPFIGYKLFGSIRDSDCLVSFIHFKWAFSNKHVWNKVIQLDTSSNERFSMFDSINKSKLIIMQKEIFDRCHSAKKVN